MKESAHPTRFSCRPADIIARHHKPWDEILEDLQRLAAEEIILTISPSLFTITQKGVDEMIAETQNIELRHREKAA